jgi:subtilisin family serine protease
MAHVVETGSMHRGMLCVLAVVAAGLLLLPGVAAGASIAPAPEDGLMHLAAAQAAGADGAGVTVAVLDTGTNAGLRVFAGRVTDGPVYVTGVLAPGDEDHGTAMSYLVLHAAPDAHILSIRVIHGDSVNGKDMVSCPICAGIKFAIARGAKVISLSLGSATGDAVGYDAPLAAAVEQALADGVTVVAASGNDGEPASGKAVPSGASDGKDDESFPAGYTGVIAVAASNSSGLRAAFSTVHSYVDVAAPGVNDPVVTENGTAALGSGTSEATALTAGVVALILSKAPRLAPWQVAQALEGTASHPHAWNPKTGYGVINASAAVRAAEAMKPASSVQAVVPYTGPSYFGHAPKARFKLRLSRQALMYAGLALLSFLAVFLLAWSGRRAKARAAALAADADAEEPQAYPEWAGGLPVRARPPPPAQTPGQVPPDSPQEWTYREL